MSKKNTRTPPNVVSITRKNGGVVVPKTPSERARIAAATVAQQQRDERTRKEALAIMGAHEPRPAPHVRDDLAAARQRPNDAPMATRIENQTRAEMESARAAVTTASIVMGIGCIAIAIWLGSQLK